MTNIESHDDGVTLRLSHAQGMALTRVLGSIEDRTGVLATLTDALVDEFFTEDDMVSGGDFNFTPEFDWEPGDASDPVAVLEVK